MECLGRLGCLFLLVVLAVGGWFTRRMWIPARYLPPPPIVNTWQPVTDAGSTQARQALNRLSQPRGPVYVTISPGDLASLGFSEFVSRGRGNVDSVAARVDDERMSLRARVSMAPIRQRLGPVAGVVRDREMMQLTGTFHVLRPGVGEFEVDRAMIGEVILPSGMIPRLIRQIDTRQRPEGLADNALLLPVPPSVSDIRVANGKITVYRNVK